MSEVKWVKLAANMFEISRSIKYIENITPGGDTILVIWIKLLCLAGMVNDGGRIYITQNVPYSRKSLAEALRKPLKTVNKALDTFCELEMISIDERGYITLTGWNKYQSTDKLEAIRAKDRERKREQKPQEYNGNSTEIPRKFHGNSTEIPRKFHGNSTEPPPVFRGASDGIPRIEEEEEEDIEYQSITLSRDARTRKGKNGVFDGVDDECDKIFDKNLEEFKRTFRGGTLFDGVVMLSDAEIDSLLEQLSLDEFNYYCGVIRDCEKKGKHYRNETHYQAILRMAQEDRMKGVNTKCS